MTKPSYLPPFYYAEVGTANKLLALLKTSETSLFNTVDEVVNSTIRLFSLMLASSTTKCKRPPFREAVTSKVMVLTGGPGTVKTPPQGIIAALKNDGPTVLLAAPTGRAAKRLSEATGLEAKTYPPAVAFNPKTVINVMMNTPWRAIAMIVDECSMIDIILMNQLLKAVPLTMRLVLVGRHRQLPVLAPQGAARLDRFAGRSRHPFNTYIPSGTVEPDRDEYAHAINRGQFPDIQQQRSQSDFFFINMDEPEAVAVPS
jgi:exodeoxyribonuclease V alpha subunit